MQISDFLSAIAIIFSMLSFVLTIHINFKQGKMQTDYSIDKQRISNRNNYFIDNVLMPVLTKDIPLAFSKFKSETNQRGSEDLFIVISELRFTIKYYEITNEILYNKMDRVLGDTEDLLVPKELTNKEFFNNYFQISNNIKLIYKLLEISEN